MIRTIIRASCFLLVPAHPKRYLGEVVDPPDEQLVRVYEPGDFVRFCTTGEMMRTRDVHCPGRMWTHYGKHGDRHLVLYLHPDVSHFTVQDTVGVWLSMFR